MFDSRRLSAWFMLEYALMQATDVIDLELANLTSRILSLGLLTSSCSDPSG